MSRACVFTFLVLCNFLGGPLAFAETHTEYAQRGRPTALSNQDSKLLPRFTGKIHFQEDRPGIKTPYLIRKHNGKTESYRLARALVGIMPDHLVEGELWQVRGDLDPKDSKPTIKVFMMDPIRDWYSDDILPANTVAKKPDKPRPVDLSFQSEDESGDPVFINLQMDDFTSRKFKVKNTTRGRFIKGGEKKITYECEEVRSVEQGSPKKLTLHMLDILEIVPTDKPPITSQSFNAPLISFELQNGNDEMEIYMATAKKPRD